MLSSYPHANVHMTMVLMNLCTREMNAYPCNSALCRDKGKIFTGERMRGESETIGEKKRWVKESTSRRRRRKKKRR